MLWGHNGHDRLYGGTGNDRLSGGNGNDMLSGGAGRDRLTGGYGYDDFVFVRPGDSPRGKYRDVIADFEHARDDIDLHRIDADTGKSGDQAFHFIGSSQFHSTAGELRYAAGVLSGDHDGNGVADFEIALLHSPHLTADDFLL